MTKATQPYSTWVEVDLDAVRENVRIIKELTTSEIMAVVKANAYGHGFIPVAKAAVEAGASWCGLARPGMATALREAGLDCKMLILGYFPPERITEMLEHSISLTAWTEAHLQQISTAAQRTGLQANVHILTDTGMGRLGCHPEKTLELVKMAVADPGLNFEGLLSHLAKADDADPTTTEQQEAVFRGLIGDLDQADLLPPYIHMANSAGSLGFPSTHFNLIRPGIVLYGMPPAPGIPLPVGIRPALSWKTVLASVKVLPPKHGVSYGHAYTTSGKETIGVLPLGYADGFRRTAGNQVLIHGKRVPVVGRVCMDQCMVQLDGIDNPQVGDEVVLIGTQGEEQITADEIARNWGTINYEVTCGISARVSRIFIH